MVDLRIEYHVGCEKIFFVFEPVKDSQLTDWYCKRIFWYIRKMFICAQYVYTSVIYLAWKAIKICLGLFWYARRICRERGTDLTQSYGKSPYTNRELKQAKWQCKIKKNWCTVTVAPTIEHHGGHSRTPAYQSHQNFDNTTNPLLMAQTIRGKLNVENRKSDKIKHHFLRKWHWHWIKINLFSEKSE